MRSRVVSSCTWLLCAALAALGAVNCTGDKTPPMPLAPAEPVAFAVHVSYCKDAAVGLDVPGTLVRLVQGSTTLEATSDDAVQHPHLVSLQNVLLVVLRPAGEASYSGMNIQFVANSPVSWSKTQCPAVRRMDSSFAAPSATRLAEQT